MIEHMFSSLGSLKPGVSWRERCKTLCRDECKTGNSREWHFPCQANDWTWCVHDRDVKVMKEQLKVLLQEQCQTRLWSCQHPFSCLFLFWLWLSSSWLVCLGVALPTGGSSVWSYSVLFLFPGKSQRSLQNKLPPSSACGFWGCQKVALVKKTLISSARGRGKARQTAEQKKTGGRSCMWQMSYKNWKLQSKGGWRLEVRKSAAAQKRVQTEASEWGWQHFFFPIISCWTFHPDAEAESNLNWSVRWWLLFWGFNMFSVKLRSARPLELLFLL